jgi:type I restriction enzyme, S subunit
MIAEQLKRSILQAAIQGKLTQQLPEDGDARDLVKEIQKEKARLIKEGKIKRDEPFPEITDDEIPFDIPENWCWSRIGQVFTLQAGNFVSSGSIRAIGNYPCYGGNGLRGYVDTFNRTGRFPLIGRQGALCGNINIGDGKFHATEHAVVVQSYCNCSPDWAAFFLATLNLNQYSTATAQPGLSVNKINQVPFPVPPIAEQKRIVERLKILPETDKLETDESKLDVLQKSFPEKMKDSILQHAIQGKLTEQLESDGDARDLLKEIQKKKVRLIKEGKIKKEKLLPEIAEDEIPFDIPESWCWVRIGDIGYAQTGTTPDTTHDEYYGKNIPFIKPPYIYDSRIDYEVEGLSPLGAKKSRIIEKNSILMVCIGGSTGKTNYCDRVVCCNQQINALTTFSNINHLFVLKAMQSHSFQNSLWRLATGTATSIVNKENWRKLCIPFPPLAEQNRIVNRLEELLPEINRLRDSINHHA